MDDATEPRQPSPDDATAGPAGEPTAEPTADSTRGATRTAAVDRVAERANELFRAGRGAEIEAALLAFDRAGLTPGEQHSLDHFLGVSAFQRGDRPEALRRYRDAATRHPESHAIRFGLAQELQHVGLAVQAFGLFDQCNFRALSARHVVLGCQYAYLWGEPERGLRWIDLICQAYAQLGNADPSFLHSRGLPDFFLTWGTLGAFHEMRGDLAPLESYTARAAATLRDFDFGICVDILDAVRSGDYTKVLAGLAQTEHVMRQQGLPDGLPRAHGAVIHALTSPGVDAEAVLDTITVTERDFPWLDDMGVLAEAAVARRAGDGAAEDTLRADFLRRQPRLFEPHWAFTFRVFDYQETLRPIYQEACRARGRADRSA